MAKNGYYTREISENLGKTPKAIQKIYRRYNFPSLSNFFPPRREERLGWKGGIKGAKGYLYKRIIDHPHKSKHGGYVAVHRLAMEKKLGRYLETYEVVDHIDGNPKNNHEDNLRLFASNAEHLRVTRKGKCPNWSASGKKSIADANRKRWDAHRERSLLASSTLN
jgi:hypothetical protein